VIEKLLSNTKSPPKLASRLASRPESKSLIRPDSHSSLDKTSNLQRIFPDLKPKQQQRQIHPQTSSLAKEALQAFDQAEFSISVEQVFK